MWDEWLTGITVRKIGFAFLKFFCLQQKEICNLDSKLYRHSHFNFDR